MSGVKKLVFPVDRQLFCSTCLLVASLVLAPASHAQEKKYAAVHTVDGATIFRSYCASCHGTDGKGHGPAAPALKYSVPDLTQIAKRSRGDFVRDRVRNIIEGAESPVPHGTREMPVWGPVFHQIDADQDLGNVRVDNLVSYIQSLQQK